MSSGPPARTATDRKTVESRLRHRISRDPLLRAIREAAERTGVETWLVGGYVRDASLGRPAHDIDLASGKGTAKMVQRLQSVWKRRGFGFRKRGVTTWRFRIRGRDVDLVDAGTRGLQTDLRRRELTVNAVAFDLRNLRLRDPLGGLRDLRSGRLRLPRRGVIREDPVRALRAARFLAQFPWTRLGREAESEAKAARGGLRRASVERIRDELNRMLEAAEPWRGLQALHRLGLLDAVLPELTPMLSCSAGRERPDVWTHTLDSLRASARPGRLPGAPAIQAAGALPELRWALLLHDVAKPDTLDHDEEGRPTFHGHEPLGGRRADAILRRLRQPRAFRKRVSLLVRYHLRPHHLAEAGAPARGMRRLVREADEALPLLLILAACDAKASGAPDARMRWSRLRPVLRSLEELHRRSLRPARARLVSGKDVMERAGLDPGPEVGRLLREVRELQIGGVLRDRQEALDYLVSRRGRISGRAG